MQLNLPWSQLFLVPLFIDFNYIDQNFDLIFGLDEQSLRQLILDMIGIELRAIPSIIGIQID